MVSPFIDPNSYNQNWRTNFGSFVTPASGFALLVDANPRRVSIFISTQQQQTWMLWPVQGAAATDGLRMNSGGQPNCFYLSLSEHGGFCQGQMWVASPNGVAIRINYVETLWIPVGG